MTQEPMVSGQAAQFEQFIVEAKQHHEAFLSCAKDSVAAAILCGQALMRARDKCEHGDWLPTLKRFWPELPTRTAYLYINAAENCNSVANLADASLRALAKAPETGNTNEKPVVITVEAVERWAHKIEAKKDDVLAWPEEKKAKLKDALRPAAELYEMLSGEQPTVEV